MQFAGVCGFRHTVTLIRHTRQLRTCVAQGLRAKAGDDMADMSSIKTGKSYCPHSQAAAKVLLATAPRSAVDVEWIDQIKEGAFIQEYLTEMTGKTTVPYVFIGSRFIGGGDETVALFQTGDLTELLAAAGATQIPDPDI